MNASGPARMLVCYVGHHHGRLLHCSSCLTLSNDCIFQDLIFYIPFGGKESIMNFRQNLMEAMGQNVHFVIDSWMEGDNLTASVIWHLEWKGKEIPHTTGCNFFECQQIDGKLIISKIIGVEELPVKPRDWVLKLLKATIVVFDKFPFPAERIVAYKVGGNT
ncbi:hypothetical protein V6Z12_D02G086000 [Gossypium hirsutum]